MRQFITTTLLLTAVWAAAVAQKAPQGISINVSNNSDYEGFEWLEQPAKDARIIMTGENHTYINFNSRMEMKMLRYLHEKTGLRHFVIELGAARAYYLNRYINDRDSISERYLKSATSPKYMDLFKKVKKYNMALPDSQKIIIWGIDVERFPDLPLLRLGELVQHKIAPESISLGVNTIKGMASYLETTGMREYKEAQAFSYSSSSSSGPGFYFGTSAQELIHYYDSLKPAFKTWLDSSFADFDLAIGWLREYVYWKSQENNVFQYVWREENIFKNLSALLDKYPHDKFYGQFGRCHIAYEEQNGDCNWYGYHSVINKIKTRYNKDPKTVLSIGIFYEGSGDYSFASDFEAREALQNEINELTASTKSHSIMLFNLKDTAAKLPELNKKFSFAIVSNKYVPTGTDDSIVSEVPTHEYDFDYFFYRALSFGMTQTNIKTDQFGKHLQANGISTTIASPRPYNVNLHFTENEMFVNFQYQWTGRGLINSTDSGKLYYGMNYANMCIGGNILQKRWLHAGIGLNIGYGREKVSYEPENVNFLTVNNPRYFVNHIAMIGPVINAQTMILKHFIVAVDVSRNWNLGVNQWFLQGTNEKYGSKNSVTKGVSGFYFGVHLGIIVGSDDWF